MSKAIRFVFKPTSSAPTIWVENNRVLYSKNSLYINITIPLLTDTVNMTKDCYGSLCRIEPDYVIGELNSSQGKINFTMWRNCFITFQDNKNDYTVNIKTLDFVVEPLCIVGNIV